MKAIHAIAFILVIVGGLNWGLVGLGGFLGGDYNVVSLILGPVSSSLVDVVYVLVGLSALALVFSHKKDCRACSTEGTPDTSAAM